MSQFILYNYYRSSTSYRARIALNLKQIKYEYMPVHLLKDGGEQHRPEYKELNPTSGVPTLIHIEGTQKHTIAQSMAIIEYLDEVKKNPHPLFPGSAIDRSLIRQICEMVNSDMHALGNLRVMQYLEKEYGADAKKKEQWIQHWVSKGFAAIETMISRHGGQFCYKDQVTAADLFIVTHAFAAQRFNVDISQFPKIKSVNDRCLEIPEFMAAHPKNQIDFAP